MTFNQFKADKSSEKSLLVHMEPSQRIITWTLHSGSVYKKVTSHYVTAVSVLTSVSAIPTGSGEFYYDPSTSTLYVWPNVDISETLVVTYRLFFSDTPLDLSLLASVVVPYKPLVDKASGFKSNFDKDQIGISLSGSGNITFKNNAGFFDSIFDKLFWENKAVSIYSYSRKYNVSKVLFKGFIQTKNFNNKTVSFNIKDFIDSLRDAPALDLFTDLDGTIREEVKEKYKRRVYGRASGLHAQSVDQADEAFLLTGTAFSGTSGAITISVTSGDLYNEASQNDEIYYINGLGDKVSFTIATVTATTITVESEIETTFSSTEMFIVPQIPYRKKNRIWHIAGHELREPTTTITNVLQFNRFDVADPSDLEGVILVNGERAVVKRVFGNTITLEQNLSSLPSASDPVTRSSIQSVVFGGKDYLETTNFTITNSTEAKITFTNTAERDVTNERNVAGSYTFTNASRTITATGVNLEDRFRPRDWIRTDTTAIWYEILSIESETSMTIRTAFAEVNTTDAVRLKRPNYLSDNSIVEIDCLGKTKSGIKTGEWIKTASDVTRDLLDDINLTDLLNLTSFTDSSEKAPYLISYKIPESPTGGLESVQSIISKMNETSLCNIYNNSDFEITYDAIFPTRPANTRTLTDHDVIDWKISTDSRNIVKSVIGNYRHKDDDISLVESHTSQLVSDLIGAGKELYQDFFLYNQAEIEEVVQRKSFYSELAATFITFGTKLEFIDSNLNEIVVLNLTRLFERFGSISDRLRVGTINSITKSGDKTNVVLSDLSNAFSRVSIIAGDASSDFTSAPKSEKIINGYITDDNGIIDDNDDTYSINLIG